MAVATGTAIAMGVGAAASAYGASQSSRAAGRAADQQKEMAMADLAFRQQQYDRYLGLFGPIEEQLAAEAKSTQPLDYDQNAAAIRQNYAQSLRDITGSMGMRGIAGGGTDIGAQRGAAFRQAGDLSGAWAQGLVNRRNLGMQLTGRGQIGQAAQGVSGGMANLGNFYGQQAGLYNQAAAQGWQNFGQGLQGLANMYGQGMFNSQPPMTYGQFQSAFQNAATGVPTGTSGYLPPSNEPVPTPPVT